MTNDAPIRLGMVRLTDSAPLAWAEHRGLFAEAGLHVTIAVEPSWANLADKLAWGLLDGAVLLQPLAIAMTLGLREPHATLCIPAGISRNGNSITLARRWADPLLQHGHLPPDQAAARLRTALAPATPLRLAVVHAFSTHDLLLRLWLHQAGIDPATQAEIVVVPPQDAVAALATHRIDGFCAGAPWGAVAARQGVGRTVAVTSAIRPHHPEKALALRQDWAQTHPAACHALVDTLAHAAQACMDPANAPALAALLARPEWLGIDADLIAASLPGAPPTLSPESDPITFTPTLGPDDADWLIQQMARWRDLPPDAAATVARMYRS